MWFEEHGSGDPLVLLHPGGADSRAWQANLPALAARFHVYTPDRRGHGRTPDAGELTFAAMVQDTIAFIERIGPVDLVGCSDGATVGLLVAHLRPDLVKRFAFVCGVFHHEGWLPGSIELDEEADAFLGGWYAEVSPDGAEHWPVVKQKLYEAHLTEPSLTPAELARIAVPTLVMIGDRDEVRIEHAVELFRALPEAQLSIVPGTSHGLLVEKPELCNAMILDFLT
jgi:pimeloyl-ACP methyl ester carboxylesterase